MHNVIMKVLVIMLIKQIANPTIITVFSIK